MTARNTFASFESKFIPEPMSGCWLWLGQIKNKHRLQQYGRFSWHGKKVLAHVFAYEWFCSPVPAGKELDHKCRNTLCVNPDHLEPVTHAENMARATHAIQTHCRRGHPYADGMERYESATHRYRRCLTCYRMKYPRTAK